jgi:hypothetical protein
VDIKFSQNRVRLPKTLAGSRRGWVVRRDDLARKGVKKAQVYGAALNGKTYFASLPTMKFLGLPNEIHSA